MAKPNAKKLEELAPEVESPASEPMETEKPEREQLHDLRLALESDLAEANRAVLSAQKMRDEITRALDGIIEQIDEQAGPHENQLAIMEYIKRSSEERAARAARVQQLMDMGADQSELAISPRSPLDQAIAVRNRNKFPKRPQYKPPTAA